MAKRVVVWSIARGLARQEAAYKDHLERCDDLRHGDLDGRGNLSEASLADCAEFFLRTCLDQIVFMRSLVEPDRLRARVILWAQEEIRADTLPASALTVLEALLNRGEVARGDLPGLTSASDRSARRITAALKVQGVVASESPRAPLRLAFPAALASRWMPGLFPEAR